MPNDEAIYILDQITPKPGKAEAFLQHYLDGYAPLAKARGLTLEYSWVNPPVWLEGGQSNTLFIVWSVKGTGAYYAAAYMARLDPLSSNWWRDADPMIETRRRAVLGDSSAIASLTNV